MNGRGSGKSKTARARLWILVIIAGLIPVGFAFKLYRGPGHWWFNNCGAGVIYVMFWCLVVYLFIPRRKNIVPICVSVLGVTVGLEFLQLVSTPGLRVLRNNFWARSLIGSTFSLLDFPHYFMGCLLGGLLMRAVGVENHLRDRRG